MKINIAGKAEIAPFTHENAQTLPSQIDLKCMKETLYIYVNWHQVDSTMISTSQYAYIFT